MCFTFMCVGPERNFVVLFWRVQNLMIECIVYFLIKIKCYIILAYLQNSIVFSSKFSFLFKNSKILISYLVSVNGSLIFYTQILGEKMVKMIND